MSIRVINYILLIVILAALGAATLAVIVYEVIRLGRRKPINPTSVQKLSITYTMFFGSLALSHPHNHNASWRLGRR